MAFNNRKPKPEHLAELLDNLSKDNYLSPNDIFRKSSLTLTATYGAIEELERQQKIVVIRQNKTPKMQVKLPN